MLSFVFASPKRLTFSCNNLKSPSPINEKRNIVPKAIPGLNKNSPAVSIRREEKSAIMLTIDPITPRRMVDIPLVIEYKVSWLLLFWWNNKVVFNNFANISEEILAL
jgi:hypothetical protein